MTYRDLVKNALLELNQIDAEEEATAADAKFVLGKLNRIFDRWNGRGVAAYVEQTSQHTLTPAVQPHTIGPSGMFEVPVRPEAILWANRLNGTTRTPIAIRNEQWWWSYSTPSVSGTYVVDLYYRPSFPNGELYFSPVPSAAVTIELMTRQAFASGTLNTTFALPPGFEDAVTKTLAVEIAEAFGATPGPILREGARDGLAQLLSNHGKRYPMAVDGGLGGRGFWDYRSGTWR
jgi:hypothetical protein